MKLIGDQVWFEGYHIANLCDNLVPTVRGEVEDAIDQLDKGTVDELDNEVRELSEQNYELKGERDDLVEELANMKTAIKRALQ